MGDTLFTTSLAGEEIARMRTWGTGDKRKGDYVQGSPCTMLDLIQPEMESILLKNAAIRGAQLSFNTEYLSHVQDAEGVTARMKDVLTGIEYEVRAKYLVGADGANSKVAKEIDLPIVGEMARAGTAYAIFNADLSKYVEHRPSILQWVATPEAGFGEIGMGLLRAIRPWDQWIAGWGFDISNGAPDLSPEVVLNKIRLLVGDPNLEVQIERMSTWYVNQAHATEYSRGRVFCAGDAVHRHPPSSGLGSNTCMQDGFNLAWKLAYVLKGFADPNLLESYTAERAPVGKQIVARANQSRKDYALLKECFNFGNGVDTTAKLLDRMRDPSPAGVEVRMNLQKALDIKSREFNAQGVELNQRYESSAIKADPGDGVEVWSRDKELYLQATTRPGAKLPHAWLVDETGHRISTLDVVGKGQMTLITGLAGQAWGTAVERLNQPLLKIVVTGAKDTADLYCHWQAAREIHEAGAVLVRPDGYVAWRQSDAVWAADDAASQLQKALQSVLG